ncbi:MAG: alpha/beta fold hydrolase [Burkholderiales bacterium]
MLHETKTPDISPFTPANVIRAVAREIAEADDKPDKNLPGANLDRMLHASLGRATQGLSPTTLIGAYMDWAIHLATSPSKQQQLVDKALRKWHRLLLYALESVRESARPDGCVCVPCIQPLEHDKRFANPLWQQPPYNLIYQAFLLNQQWWHNATTEVRGVSAHHEHMVNFLARQWLDMFSPSNFLPTNPELQQVTMQQGGMNLINGMVNWWANLERQQAGRPPAGAEKFRPGETVAITPGKVVMRNRLCELIEYTPTASQVYAEPLLIVPSWIMKYYILDLSPQNSLVKYLVGQGHRVFMLSWKNPDENDRDLSMDDYLRLGLLAALDAITNITGTQKIHAAGYCLGGTLLAIAAAKLARENDQRLKTVSLLAAQADFDEPGELGLFIDESQIAHLDDIMWDQGYLDGGQMAASFQFLNSKDLVWSKLVRDYMTGTPEPLTDLAAWNADATRLPYRMHSDYLRHLYLNNELAHGSYKVEGKPVALTDIRLPIFALGTERDHVSPWRSAYKIQLLTDADITFALSSGGHNVGIVNPPGSAGHPSSHYRMLTHKSEERYTDPDAWLASAKITAGSWWPAWHAWLAQHSGKRASANAGHKRAKKYTPLADAPGSYVMQR